MITVTEVDGVKFKLTALGDKPYVLKRWQRPNGVGRWYWGIVWAEWHKGLPTGIRKRAMAACGYEWRNDSSETLGWWLNGSKLDEAA
jgi:hypothetical protein